MFSTKHLVLILITQPLNLYLRTWTNPTVRDISRGLREHFRIIRTRRHIRRLLRELEQEGIIRRENRSWHTGRFGSQEQATSYEILDFYKAFQNHLSLTRQSKVIVARERRRRKRKEV
ncbi:hypothetical protein ES703_24773 [subsurface metagenome]